MILLFFFLFGIKILEIFGIFRDVLVRAVILWVILIIFKVLVWFVVVVKFKIILFRLSKGFILFFNFGFFRLNIWIFLEFFVKFSFDKE